MFATGQRFRNAVIAYCDPDTGGVNKLDSPRVNAFYDALLTVPGGTSQAAALPPTLLPAARALTKREAIYVRNQAGAPRELTTVMTQRLQGHALSTVHGTLNARATSSDL